ncbi:MAG: glycerate kinase [Rhodoferax sp.]
MNYRLSRPLQSALVVLSAVLLLSWAYHRYGGLGLAGALGALVMCALVYLSRFIKVMRLVSQRPVGHVESAVMLHARLRRGMPLLRVLAMTGALGQALTEPGVEPELFRWTDASHSSVDCEFVGGRVNNWTLRRPDTQTGDAAQ